MPETSLQSSPQGTEQRRRWMAVLAKAEPGELERAVAGLDEVPEYAMLRAPEAGMVMVQGRASGTGGSFNLGEMTVTRCSVQLDGAISGHAYIAGRNLRHAELAAVIDAMLQSPQWHDALVEQIITPLADAHGQRRTAAGKKANATKVNFFTMVRGENMK